MTEFGKAGVTRLPWHELDFMEEWELSTVGAKLHFAQSHNANSTSLPTIVFLHGVLRNWRSFYPLLKALRGKANLVSIDFRGHGGSDPTPNAYFVANYAEDAVRLLESLPNPVVLYGHSLGAMVALATAAQLPKRISTAILEDPPFSTMGGRIFSTPLLNYFQSVEAIVQNEASYVATQTEKTIAEQRIQRLFEEFSNIAVAAQPDGSILRVRDQRDLLSRRFSAEGLARVDPQVLAPITAGQWLNGYELDCLLQSIQSKVVLLRADNACGGMLNSHEADYILQRLGGLCESIYFPGAGHSLHWAKPSELTELVIRQF